MLILQGNVAQLVKNLPAIAGDRDTGSIPGWERSPGEENGAPIQFLAGEIPRIKKPGGLQSMELQRVRHN